MSGPPRLPHFPAMTIRYLSKCVHHIAKRPHVRNRTHQDRGDRWQAQRAVPEPSSVSYADPGLSQGQGMTRTMPNSPSEIMYIKKYPVLLGRGQ